MDHVPGLLEGRLAVRVVASLSAVADLVHPVWLRHPEDLVLVVPKRATPGLGGEEEVMSVGVAMPMRKVRNEDKGCKVGDQG